MKKTLYWIIGIVAVILSILFICNARQVRKELRQYEYAYEMTLQECIGLQQKNDSLMQDISLGERHSDSLENDIRHTAIVREITLGDLKDAKTTSDTVEVLKVLVVADSMLIRQQEILLSVKDSIILQQKAVMQNQEDIILKQSEQLAAAKAQIEKDMKSIRKQKNKTAILGTSTGVLAATTILLIAL